ncbi:hypothetical protein [Vibrio rotiferianus]|uniref:hypothetical protein n=1 Tax=Vibrio rotiferianus TaxID=190895 RepID=UPI003908DB3F
MKKITLIAATVASFCAYAMPEHDKAGRDYARITACHLNGKLTKAQRDIANLSVIAEYRITERPQWWKDQVKKARKEEYKALKHDKPIELGVKCALIKGKYFK